MRPCRGCAHIDAARSYGRAEEFLSSWLRTRSIEPGALTVSSKWGYTYTADWRIDADPPEVKELTAETLRRQLKETRNCSDRTSRSTRFIRRRSPAVCWTTRLCSRSSPNSAAPASPIGASVSGTEQSATITRLVELGCFDVVQATWNLLERSAGDALRSAHDAGMGVIVKEALANGRLTARGGIAPLAHAAARLATSEDAVAIAGVLARPWADTVLSGASTVDQLQSNLQAREVVWDDQLEAELASLAMPTSEYWDARSELPWKAQPWLSRIVDRFP